MQVFNDWKLKFEHPDWTRNPEFALIDTILEKHPEVWSYAREDVLQETSASVFGRKDTPSVEQVVRAGIFKALKGLNYRDLEYAQSDSRICANFIKLDDRKPFSFQVFQKYISKISAESLDQVLVGINQIAIDEGFEDIKALRTDTTVVKSNIHYPTNNSLVWDCIKESYRLLEKLSKQVEGLSFRDYRKSAKSNFFKINNLGKAKQDQRVKVFRAQLNTFTKCINQIDQVVRNPKKKAYSCKARDIIKAMEYFLPTMEQVFCITKRKEILGEMVPNYEKIFSIYEPHTDIIVKGGREVEFGHKVQITGGKSNLILDCMVVDGNPSDRSLYTQSIERVEKMYDKVPRDFVVDGGYTSKDNLLYSIKKGIKNVVFNKVTRSLKSKVSSSKIRTTLNRWRSGIEAVISNFKRRFNMRVNTWKGYPRFTAKVLWSAIGYNIRVLTAHMVSRFY